MSSAVKSDINPRGLFDQIPEPSSRLSDHTLPPAITFCKNTANQAFSATLVKELPELTRLDRIVLLTAGLSSARYDERPSEAPGLMLRTRLEHSVEVDDLVTLMCERNPSLSVVTKVALRLAALHHDIGHTPFSHVGERALHNLMGFDHDIEGERLCKCPDYLQRLRGPLEHALALGKYGRGLDTERVLEKFGQIISEHPKYLRLGAALRDVCDTSGYLSRDIMLAPISSRIALQVSNAAFEMVNGSVIDPETEALYLRYAHRKKDFDNLLRRIERRGAQAITSEAIESGLVPAPLVVQEGRRLLHAVFNQEPRVCHVNRVLGVYIEMAALRASDNKGEQYNFLKRFAALDDQTALEVLREVPQASRPLAAEPDGYIAPDRQYKVSVSVELDGLDMEKAKAACQKVMGDKALSSEIGGATENYLQSAMMTYFYSTKNADIYPPPIVTVVPTFSKHLRFSMLDREGEVFQFSSKTPTIASDRTAFLALHEDLPEGLKREYVRIFENLIRNLLTDKKSMSYDNLFEQNKLTVPLTHFFNDTGLGYRRAHTLDMQRSQLMQILSGRVRVGL